MRRMSLKQITLCCVLTLCAVTASGQATVDSLKTRLVNKPVTVKIEGLRASRGVLFKSVDTRIQDGVIQKRLFSPNGPTDEVLNPGDKVRVTKIEVSSDKKNDFLRLTIAAADGPTVPVAFVFAKGTLATEDSSQLEQEVGKVFDLSSAGAPPMAAVAPPPPPPDAPPVPAPVSGWRVQENKSGNKEAAIPGTGGTAGKTGPAVMALTCAGAEIRVRRPSVPAPDKLECVGDMDGGNDGVKFKVGERPFEAGSICTDEQINTPTVVKLPVDLGAGGLDQILASPGSLMQIEIAFSEIPSDLFAAKFNLPQDASAIEFLRACNGPPKPEPTADACPNLAGKGLRKVELLTIAGKPYIVTDPDNDIGIEWVIPKATPKHPAHPKLVLACYYGFGLKPNDPKEPLEKKIIPVSATSTVCTARGDVTVGELTGKCGTVDTP